MAIFCGDAAPADGWAIRLPNTTRENWVRGATIGPPRRGETLLRKPPMSQRERRARDERRHPEWRVRNQTHR